MLHPVRVGVDRRSRKIGGEMKFRGCVAHGELCVSDLPRSERECRAQRSVSIRIVEGEDSISSVVGCCKGEVSDLTPAQHVPVEINRVICTATDSNGGPALIRATAREYLHDSGARVRTVENARGSSQDLQALGVV